MQVTLPTHTRGGTTHAEGHFIQEWRRTLCFIWHTHWNGHACVQCRSPCVSERTKCLSPSPKKMTICVYPVS